MSDMELIGSRGCGSAIVEMALEQANIPYRLTDLPYLKPGPGRDRLLSLNTAGQVPTLVLPDGQVMTESAAIMLHLNDIAPAAGLVPPKGPERARCWNLLIRLVSSIYPTFTYSDIPENWTTAGPGAQRLRQTVRQRREQLWREFESQTGEPHVLGRRYSVLDLYVAVMTHWYPGRAWFETECPRIHAAALRAAESPVVAGVLARHFDPPSE